MYLISGLIRLMIISESIPGSAIRVNKGTTMQLSGSETDQTESKIDFQKKIITFKGPKIYNVGSRDM